MDPGSREPFGLLTTTTICLPINYQQDILAAHSFAGQDFLCWTTYDFTEIITEMPGPTGSISNGGGGEDCGGMWWCINYCRTAEDLSVPGNCGSGGPLGWIPIDNSPPLSPLPIDSLLSRISRAINQKVDSISPISFNNVVEWGFIIVQKDSTIYPKNATTQNLIDDVVLDTSTSAGETTIAELHFHPDSSTNLYDRSAPSGSDLFKLKLKQGVLNYIVFVECGNKRYALVNENPLQTQRFFNNKGKAFLHKQLYLQSLGNINAYTNWQLATEQELVALIGSSLISGIGVYSSTNPDKTLYQKLNF